MIDRLLHDVVVGPDFFGNPAEWLANRADPGMKWLLAHADDGVIWGRREDNGPFTLSGAVFDRRQYPSIAIGLRGLTLQQARVFGEEAELMVWKSGDGFAGRIIRETSDFPVSDSFDEDHLLWGKDRNDIMDVGARFTLLKEGQQGLMHAPPMRMPARGRMSLTVRHYLDYDDQQQAFIALSRLVRLNGEKK